MSLVTPGARPTQADRRARTRSALLESAARGLSRYGYANLSLERVASEAGYSRGALYHLFANKEELAMAVVAWVEETWWSHMAELIPNDDDPIGGLVAVVRAHAVYCRRDVARVMMTLRVEFSDVDHPVGRAVREAEGRVYAEAARAIGAAQSEGAISKEIPPDVLARAVAGAVEGLVINLSGQAPFDEVLAERTVLGLLGLPSSGAM